MDERVKKLAANLVNYSCGVKENDKVLVHHMGESTEELARAVIKEVYRVKAIPISHHTSPRIQRELLMHATEEQIQLMAKIDSLEMSSVDCYIAIRGSENFYEMADVPLEKLSMYETHYIAPVHLGIRVPNTRWVALRYPNGYMAQLATTSTEAFEDFFYDVCCLDYSKMREAMKPLVELMERTDRVRLTGPGTDLSFSIKDIPVIPCSGEMNIPDGEVFTAPVRDSVNGKITYNTPSLYQGFTYENVCLEFKDGKIISATANDTTKINQVFNTDEGARYVGEFAIGVNPYILEPMRDTLFDEKIAGSFHFTPGKCYDGAPNGNQSAIHWDLVNIQRKEYGGGEIYFDDVLIRKDGIFVVPELEGLNPDNLK